MDSSNKSENSDESSSTSSKNDKIEADPTESNSTSIPMSSIRLRSMTYAQIQAEVNYRNRNIEEMTKQLTTSSDFATLSKVHVQIENEKKLLKEAIKECIMKKSIKHNN